MVAESKYTELEFYKHANSLLLQDIVELRYVKNRGEQERILRACHVGPTAGHMGVKCTLWCIIERFMWYGLVKGVEQLVCITIHFY